MSCRRKSQTIHRHTCSSSIATSSARDARYFSALAQYMFFAVERGNFLGRVSARISEAVRPLRVTVAASIRLGSVDFLKLRYVHANFLGKRVRCGVGCPSLYATCADGPFTCSVMSGCDAGIPEARTANRRGVSRCEIALEGADARAGEARPVFAQSRERRQSSAPESLRIRFRVKSLASGDLFMFSELRQCECDHITHQMWQSQQRFLRSSASSALKVFTSPAVTSPFLP